MSESKVSIQIKRHVIERAQGCCEYCRNQIRFTNQSFSIEHIFPKVLGGKTTLKNLALSCQSCNNHKYNKIVGQDSVTDEEVPLFHPREQQWEDHFAWNDDCSLIIGLTPTGRATIATLLLNKSGLVNLRRILFALGEHPPPTH